MARRELRQRRDKRSWRKTGVTVDGKKFFRNHLALDQDWHKKQVAASILKPHVITLKNRTMNIAFQRWNDHRLRFITLLAIKEQTEEANKLSGADMAEIFEQKHAGDFARQAEMPSKWDDTEDHPPWHPAVNIRMPILPTEHSIGAVGTKEGKVKINDIDRWNYWKDRMCGPIENSHWLLRGPDGKNGPSVYANVLIGGYPNGFAKKGAGVSLKNDALVALLRAGIDTFICLMPKEEIKATEGALGLLEKLTKQRQLQHELEEAEKTRMQKGQRRRVSGVARKGRRGSALSNFALREAEKEFEKNNMMTKERQLSKLGPDPPYFKIQLIEHHTRLQKEMSVGLDAAKKRYERALAGAEKAKTYAAAQRAVMEAKRADALDAVKLHVCLDISMGFGTQRLLRLFNELTMRGRICNCHRAKHAVQRHFVYKFLLPMTTMYNPVDLRGEDGPVTAYSMTREEVFAESQTHTKNKFKEAREKKNLEIALSMGIGADDDSENDREKR
eukprot:g5255.t1